MFSFFERLLEPFPERSELSPPSRFIAFCRFYSRGSTPFLILMAVLSAATAVMEVALFGFLGRLVDLLNETSPGNLWQEAGSQLIGMALLVLVVLPGTVAFKSLLIHQTLLGNFPMAIRWLTHRLLLGQSIQFFQDEFAGRLTTKVMQTSLAVREFIMKLLDVLMYVSVYFTSIVVMLASLDWRLAVPFLVWFIIYAILLRHFLPKLEKISSRQADARAEMTGRIVDTYTNIHTVKLFSHGQRESRYARDAMQLFLGTVHPQMRLATSLYVSVWIVNCTLAFGVAAQAIYLWSVSVVTAGVIAAAIGLVLRLFGMSQWIMWEISSLFENIGTVRDGMNTLTEAPTVLDIPDAQELKVTGHSGIRFDQVDFQYGKDIPVFHQLDLAIAPGERIGLVGRSGAGKSTLVNLLLRFYDIDDGKILIDNQNIASVQQRSLRANIGMVTQDTSLLHRSIRDNILYGQPLATEEEMIEAAKRAQAHEFILQLRDAKGRRGYDAHAGERGVKLSGGQRQRIAIARVLLKNAPILVLDEATSALDSEIEQAIQENLMTLMEDKTVIAIAHRLSTIAAMDRLVVIDQGKIVEIGHHDELLAAGGIYAKLWERQSGGFLAEDIETKVG